MLIKNRNIYTGIFKFFIIANIIDMKGSIGVKMFSFILIALTILLNLKYYKFEKKEILLISIFLVLYPIVNIIIGFQNSSDLLLALENNSFFIVSILIYIYIKRLDEFENLYFIFNFLFIWAIFSILLNLMWYFNTNSNLYLILTKLFSHNTDTSSSIRLNGQFVPRVYLQSTLFFIAPFIYFLFKGKVIKPLITFVAILLSGSRGSILICFIIFIYYSFSSFKIKDILKVIIFSSFLIGTSFIIFKDYHMLLLEHILNLFDTKSTGAESGLDFRLVHLEDTINKMNSSAFYSLFGFGSGTPFYSELYREKIYSTELSEIDLLRKYGLIWTAGFLTFVGLVIKKNFYNQKIGLVLFSLLIATLTNPILTAPLFISIFLLSNNLKIDKT